MMENNVPLCPVTGWSVQTVDNENALTLQVDFISHPGESRAELRESCHFLMTTDQAFALTWAIHQSINRVGEDT
jgi:hypothetical protein